MPRLSVLMPARNAERTITAAVVSTLRALPADAELVVLDDASSDGTSDILARIDHRRLRVEHSSTRLGVSQGLTRLLAVTDSELVGRMDADDVTLPARFRLERAALRDADAVFSTVVERNDRRLRMAGTPSPIGPREFPFRLLLGNPVAHPTMVARRSVIVEAGGYRAVPAEDYDLWLRLSTTTARIRRIALPTLVYRIHPGQQTDAEGWQRSSWHDPMTNTAFADLSRALLGQPHPRLTTLAVTADDDEFEVELQRFQWAFLAAVSARFDERATKSLRSRLQRRVSSIRALRETHRVNA